MSKLVTIDWQCDRCPQWTHGGVLHCVSGVSNAKEAWNIAKSCGWRRIWDKGKRLDLCPKCYDTARRGYKELEKGAPR